jgi:hypothetical protein
MYWSKNRQNFLFEFNWINTFEVQKYRFIACHFQPRSWWTISSSHCFNTNQMRIEFNEALNFEAKLVQLRRGCHSTALLFLIPIWSLDVIHCVHGLYQIVIILLQIYSSFTPKYGFDFNWKVGSTKRYSEANFY